MWTPAGCCRLWARDPKVSAAVGTRHGAPGDPARRTCSTRQIWDDCLKGPTGPPNRGPRTPKVGTVPLRGKRSTRGSGLRIGGTSDSQCGSQAPASPIPPSPAGCTPRAQAASPGSPHTKPPGLAGHPRWRWGQQLSGLRSGHVTRTRGHGEPDSDKRDLRAARPSGREGPLRAQGQTSFSGRRGRE